VRKKQSWQDCVSSLKKSDPCSASSCSQFLWINLCETWLPALKPLIPIGKFKRSKMKQVCAISNSRFACCASTHFLWTKLCASEHIACDVIDFKGKSYYAQFLINMFWRATAMTLHTNCGKRCEQTLGAISKFLISFKEPLHAQFLGKHGQPPVPDRQTWQIGHPVKLAGIVHPSLPILMHPAFCTNFVEKIVSKDLDQYQSH